MNNLFEVTQPVSDRAQIQPQIYLIIKSIEKIYGNVKRIHPLTQEFYF